MRTDSFGLNRVPLNPICLELVWPLQPNIQKHVNLNLDSCQPESDRHELVVQIRFRHFLSKFRILGGTALTVRPYVHYACAVTRVQESVGRQTVDG